MKFLFSLVLATICLVSYGADTTTPKSTRVDTRTLSGQTLLTQGEFNRANVPVFLTPGVLSHTISNTYDGVIFGYTNLTATIYVFLPNPTNNVGRKFTFVPMGSCTMILTNTLNRAFDFTYAYGRTNSTGFTIASNVTAEVWSTGTNYIGVTY